MEERTDESPENIYTEPRSQQSEASYASIADQYANPRDAVTGSNSGLYVDVRNTGSDHSSDDIDESLPNDNVVNVDSAFQAAAAVGGAATINPSRPLPPLPNENVANMNSGLQAYGAAVNACSRFQARLLELYQGNPVQPEVDMAIHALTDELERVTKIERRYKNRQKKESLYIFSLRNLTKAKTHR